ncbi:YHS domain-containing (seleno)protein [Glaciecola sp. 1036]|uniref:YHS domain-containing (seleno)protein n=1 Tax=Alteromonadaceae TaxID=72275 RepID=UPI003CFC6F51
MTNKLLSVIVIGVTLTLASCGIIPTQANSSIEAINVDESRLAIKGYDPVAYFTQSMPVEGSASYTAEYKGAIYHFASAEHQSLFKANPAKYAPQYGGYCAFGVSKEKKFDTDPTAWAIVDNKLYLNLNDKVQGRWVLNKEELISEANEIWQQIENTPVSEL